MDINVSEDFISRVITAIGDDVEYAFVHESALWAWGIDYNAMLPAVDLLVCGNEGFEVMGAKAPIERGDYAETETDGIPVRIWSRASLGLIGPFDVTACPRYGAWCLAPELVLAKLPYSPDFPLLTEMRARLAAIVYAGKLSDEEIALTARYVRGE